MVRATAVLVSLALHTAAALAVVALAAGIRLPPPLRPASPPARPLHFSVQHKARQTAPDEAHRAPPPSVGRGLRTKGRPQFGETLLVRAAPALPAARPAPSIETYAAASRPAELDGDSSRRGPPLADPVQWSTLLLVGAGRARAPAPSAFCVPRRPAMPEEAVEQDVSGRVVARYDVGVTGEASAIEFVNRPPEALAGAVRDWLRGCLFEPALLNGRPVPVRQEQSFLFVLR